MISTSDFDIHWLLQFGLDFHFMQMKEGFQFNRELLSISLSLGGVFLRDVSCYFSVLEEGQPREKLEC